MPWKDPETAKRYRDGRKAEKRLYDLKYTAKNVKRIKVDLFAKRNRGYYCYRGMLDR